MRQFSSPAASCWNFTWSDSPPVSGSVSESGSTPFTRLVHRLLMNGIATLSWFGYQCRGKHTACIPNGCTVYVQLLMPKDQVIFFDSDSNADPDSGFIAAMKRVSPHFRVFSAAAGSPLSGWPVPGSAALPGRRKNLSIRFFHS